jgi:hypothetical protein
MAAFGSSRAERPDVAGSCGTRVEVWSWFAGGNICGRPRERAGNERKRRGFRIAIRYGDSLRMWPSGRISRGAPAHRVDDAPGSSLRGSRRTVRAVQLDASTFEGRSHSTVGSRTDGNIGDVNGSGGHPGDGSLPRSREPMARRRPLEVRVTLRSHGVRFGGSQGSSSWGLIWVSRYGQGSFGT